MSSPSKLTGEAFGTTWSVTLRTAAIDQPALHDRIASELEQIERRLSHWRADSETSQFNGSATTLELECSPELFSLVEFAQRLSRETDGAFDITVGPLVNAWGYGPAGPRADEPSPDEIAKLLAATGWQKLHIDAQWKTLRKEHPELQIDLGSLLQGYAVDRVAAVLDAAGVTEYLIEIGGELRTRGAWTVAIEDPGDPSRPLRTLSLRDAALSTSGVYRKSSTDAAGVTRHVISPKTGRPIDSGWRLCAVIARTCLEADGWDTALLASEHEATLTIAERNGIATLLVDDAGAITISTRFAAATR